MRNTSLLVIGGLLFASVSTYGADALSAALEPFPMAPPAPPHIAFHGCLTPPVYAMVLHGEFDLNSCRQNLWWGEEWICMTLADLEREWSAASKGPIYYATGMVSERAVDLALPGPPPQYRHLRTYNQGIAASDVGNGKGWTYNYFEYLYYSSDFNTTTLWLDAHHTYVFAGSEFSEAEDVDRRLPARLTHNHLGDPNQTYHLEWPDGSVWLFNEISQAVDESVRGRIIARIAPTGYYHSDGDNKDCLRIYYGGDAPPGRVDHIIDPAGRWIQYAYVGDHLGALSAYKVSDPNDPNDPNALIAKVEFTYMDESDPNNFNSDCGTNGDLLEAKTTVLATADTAPALTLVSKTQYRYYGGGYDPNTNPGDIHYLRTILRPESVAQCESLINDPNRSVLARDNAYVQPFANNRFEYYETGSDGRVRKEIVRTPSGGGGGCCGSSGQPGAHRYTYTMLLDPNDPNNPVGHDYRWIPWSRTLEELLDANDVVISQVYVESNYFNQMILSAQAVPGDGGFQSLKAATFGYYSDDGTDAPKGYLSGYVPPETITGLTVRDPPNGIELTFNDNGPCYGYTYDRDHANQRKLTTRRKFSDYVNVEKLEEYAWTWLPNDVHPDPNSPRSVIRPVSKTHFDDPNHTGQVVEQYSYVLWPDPNTAAPTQLVKLETVTRAAVDPNQQGSGVATVSKRFYDRSGNLRFAKDGEGRVHYLARDTRFNSIALEVADAKITSSWGSIEPNAITSATAPLETWTSDNHNDLPSDFKTNSADAVKLVEQVEYDVVGRARSRTDVASVKTYFAYGADPNNFVLMDTRSYPAWDPNAPQLPWSRTTVTASTDANEPVLIVEHQTAQASSYSGANPPTGAETWPVTQSNWVSWSRQIKDKSGRVALSRIWHNIPDGGGEGSGTTNYTDTKHTYDFVNSGGEHGTQHEVQDAANGWRRYVYDAYGHLTKTYSAHPASNPPSTWYLVEENAYGQQSDANAPLYGTQLVWRRAYFGNGGNDYTKTLFTYDWRGDLKVSAHRDGVGTATPPHVVRDFDYYGNVTAVGEFATDPNSLDPNTSAASTTTGRTSLQKSYYDLHQRLYRTERLAIDPNGVVEQESGGHDELLATRYFYDRNERIVAVDPPNGGLTISKYDGAGRELESWTCSEMEHDPAAVYDPNTGAFNYDNSNIKVVEKALLTLNLRGQTTKIEGREVNHTETGGLGASNYIANWSYNWYDTFGRLTTAAYYGTNSGNGWENGSDPNVVSEPNASDTSALVTKYLYDPNDARLLKVTDPKGLDTQYLYDDLGRTTAVIEDQSESAGHKNRRTEYAYDTLSNVSTITAKSAVNIGGYTDEVTEYVRDHTVDPDWVTKIRYPDPNSGQPSDATADTVAFTYYYDGAAATRRDQNNSTMMYDYDGRRRLAAQKLTTAGSGVDNAVKRIAYVYDNPGRLQGVTSYDADTGGNVVNEVKLDYDGFAKLAKDFQSHSGSGDPNSPYVGYTYQHATATDDGTGSAQKQNSFNRLQKVRLPNGRVVWYDYAHATSGIGTLDYLLSRVGQLADDNGGSKGKVFAQYDFNGLSRLVQRDHLNTGSGSGGKPGNKTALRYLNQGSSTPAYLGFDRFGRIINQRHVNYNGLSDPNSASASVPVYLKYGYDYNSNRTRTENAYNAGISHVYSYDNLNRLTADKLGYYVSGDITSKWNPPAEQDWTLDPVGNWEDTDQKHSGTSADETRTHNATNEIKTKTAVAQAAQYWADDTFANTNNWDAPLGGAWSTSSNKLQCDTVVNVSKAPGGQGSMFLLPGDYQDIRISTTVTFSGGGNYGGIVFGYVDSNNYWVLLQTAAPTTWYLYQVSAGTWTSRGSGNVGTGGDLYAEIRSGSVTKMPAVSDYDASSGIPAGRVGVWAGTGSDTVKFGEYKVRSMAANCIVDGRFSDDVGGVQVTGNKLQFNAGDTVARRSVLRHVRMGRGVVQVNLTWQNLSAGIILNYQDPENFGVALLDYTGGANNVMPRYVEFKDGKKLASRYSGSSFALTVGTSYTLKAVVNGTDPNQTLTLYVGGTQRLQTNTVDDSWSGGCVGLYGAPGAMTALVWDDFKCGQDNNADGDIDDAGDFVYANYDFNGANWYQLTFSHDDNGNLTDDGLFKYTFDAWNRLVGAWYNAGDPNDPNQRVATYKYDGLFRRTEKVVGNQGVGIVYNSDKGSVTGIQAGNRHEHYFYSGWRLVETTDHASGDPYGYGGSHVLSQFVYGTQYIDEPVCYDRNLDPNTDNSCLEAGDARYFYQQDANFRVVMLTGENGAVVERYEYTAYGEPTVYGGYSSGAGDELGNAQLVSTVGNPLQHQGLFRDREIAAYQNRFREYHSRSGTFVGRDRLGYINGQNLYVYLNSAPLFLIDPLGTDIVFPEGTSEEFKKQVNDCLDAWKDDPVLGPLIKRLRESKTHHVTIKSASVNATNPDPGVPNDYSEAYNKKCIEANDNARKPGVGASAVIFWNPKIKALKTGPEKERAVDPCASLIHELTHAGQIDEGSYGAKDVEQKAVQNENRARYKYGNNQRTEYNGKKLEDPGPWPPNVTRDDKPAKPADGKPAEGNKPSAGGAEKTPPVPPDKKK